MILDYSRGSRTGADSFAHQVRYRPAACVVVPDIQNGKAYRIGLGLANYFTNGKWLIRRPQPPSVIS